MADKISGESVSSLQYSTPTTGGTVNLTRADVVHALLDPAGTLATLTVNLPTSPLEGDQVVVATSQIITALTIGNGTIIGTLTTLALGAFARFRYHAATTKWFRIG